MTEANSSPPAAPVEEPLDNATILGMVAMALAVLVIANDFTALSVALPAMETDFKTDLAHVQWVINGYALIFGVFIVTGGRLADMFGRRKIFFAGAAIFAIFSLIGGFAPNLWVLIGARFIMGLGGAMMWPAILGMTYSILPESRVGLAGGLILGSAGFGNAVGPLLGGVLTDFASWRWIFFLNVPIAAFAVFVTFKVVPPHKPEGADQRIDYGGVATLSLGLLFLLLALSEGTHFGWSSPWVIAMLVGSAVFLAAFFTVERSIRPRGLIPPDVLENVAFIPAFVTTLLNSAIFFAALIYLPQFTAKVFGYSAVESGAALIPMMGVFAITSFIAGPLYAKLGAKLIVSLGAGFLTLGMLLLSMISKDTTMVGLLPGMVVLGIGIGLFYSSITTAGITAVDKSRASLAGALIYMAQIAGGSIGLGVNTAIVLSASSLARGIHWAYLLNTVLAFSALLIAAFLIGGRIGHQELKAIPHRHRAHG